MRRDSLWHRIVQAVLPWYHDDEVEARNSRMQSGMADAQHAMEHAARVTTGTRSDTIRESARQIATRLDGTH